jgi:hypothetical protein
MTLRILVVLCAVVVAFAIGWTVEQNEEQFTGEDGGPSSLHYRDDAGNDHHVYFYKLGNQLNGSAPCNSNREGVRIEAMCSNGMWYEVASSNPADPTYRDPVEGLDHCWDLFEQCAHPQIDCTGAVVDRLTNTVYFRDYGGSDNHGSN